MQKQEIVTLIAYSNWATDRVLQMAAYLSPAQFIALVTPNPGWGSVRGILVHMLSAEYGWRYRMQHRQAVPDLVETDFPDIATVVMRWDEERQAWQHYLGLLDEAQINGTYSYRSSVSPYPIRTFWMWHTLLHVLNHSTQHRAEIAMMLTGYEYSPGELDLGTFLRK